jgi:hypothetical protein
LKLPEGIRKIPRNIVIRILNQTNIRCVISSLLAGRPSFRNQSGIRPYKPIKEQVMKKYSLSALALASILAAGSAFAGSCPMDMKQIDAAMATSSLSTADMDKVKALRAQGEKLHKSGDHAGSVAALDEAKTILGI